MTQNYQLLDVDGATEAPATSLPKFKSILESLLTNNSGGSEPSRTYPWMFWADVASDLLKQRNSANNGWINRGPLTEAWSPAPSSGPSSIATAQRLTARRVDTAQINIQSTALVMTNPNGFTRLVPNINVTGDIAAGGTPNSWRHVWLTANYDLSIVGLVGRAVGDPAPTNAWSALVSCVRLNASGQVPAMNQVGRNIYYAGNRVLNSVAQVTVDTAILMSSAVPPLAETVHYMVEMNRTASGTTLQAALKPHSGANANVRPYQLRDNAGATQQIVTLDSMDLVEQQRMWFTRGSGAWTLTVDVLGYAY